MGEKKEKKESCDGTNCVSAHRQPHHFWEKEGKSFLNALAAEGLPMGCVGLAPKWAAPVLGICQRRLPVAPRQGRRLPEPRVLLRPPGLSEQRRGTGLGSLTPPNEKQAFSGR